MNNIRITSQSYKNQETMMKFLTPEIFYPNVPVEELFSDKVTIPMTNAREVYQSYLNSIKHKINNKLLNLYMGDAPYLGRGDKNLHDFLICKLTYNGIEYNSKKSSDTVQMILDARNGYEYELFFDDLQYFRTENALYRIHDFRGWGKISLCEIGIINDIKGCNFLSCHTSSACEMSIWFNKFNFQVRKKVAPNVS